MPEGETVDWRRELEARRLLGLEDSLGSLLEEEFEVMRKRGR